MSQVSHEELTIVDIKALAASIYEPEPRLWVGERWRCPQCLKLNQRRKFPDDQCQSSIGTTG